MNESPIFVKTFDLLKWVIQRTEKFPKTQRFFLAKRINDALFDFYELIGDAALLNDGQREQLRQADARLMRLKHYFRLAMENAWQRNCLFPCQTRASRIFADAGKSRN